jgi:putative ABC transport system permease protein
VLALTALMTALSAIGFSLGPALQLCADRAAAVLKEYGRGSASRGRWARSVLVVVEVALSVILLTGAALFIVSLVRLQQVDAGFNPEHVLTMRVDLPAQRPAERTTAFVETALERIQALPGVVAAGATTALPLAEGAVGRLFTIDGQPVPRSFAEIPVIQYRQVTPDYMKTLQVMVRRGRPFASHDDASQPRVAIVNETLANRFFGNSDPIGRRVYLGPHEALSGPAGRFPRLTIVGVIRDLRHRGLEVEVQPELFVPYEQREEVRVRGLIFSVRGASNVISAAAVRGIIHDLEPTIPVSDVRTMEERLQVSLSGRRFTVSLLGLFASVALVLAAIGIYGVVTYTVGRRLPEIGIRLALGARPSSVVALMLRQSAALILSGVVIGVVGSLALTRFVQAFLFQVRATDPWIHLAIIVLLACVALSAAYLPARRAARIDPLIALRRE